MTSRLHLPSLPTSIYLIAGALFVLGVWFHIPYAGGHVYSDIVTVFQNRFCYSGPCTLGIPYVNVFVEYPVLTGLFMWAMALLGNYLPLSTPGDLRDNYYRYTTIVLVIVTFLLIRETLRIAEILGIADRVRKKRTLIYLIATPSFIFMLLLNWYIIGVFFAMFGLRKFLEGSRWASGFLLGISAAANLVTAVPALGMFLFDDSGWGKRARFALGMGIAVLACYLPLLIVNSFPHNYINSNGQVIHFPFVFLNTNFITDFLSYQQNWYIEGSWMLAFFDNLDPIRHIIFPALFVLFSVLVFFEGRKLKAQMDQPNLIVTMSWMFTFAFLFSTYVCTPQMNLILLPFFVLFPIAKYYPEFLAFDIVNSLVILWGFSQPLLAFGVTIPTPVQFGPIWQSPIQFLAVLRSVWIGKFLIVDGLLFARAPLKASQGGMTGYASLASAIKSLGRRRLAPS